MSRPQIRRFLLPAACIGFVLVLLTGEIRSRLISPPSMAEVRDLAERAPLVFRGQVVAVTPVSPSSDPHTMVVSHAKFQVDRWYRGNGPTEVSLRFAYPDFASNGHNCINFQPGAYWLV